MRKVHPMISFSVPLWITSSDPDFDWLRGKLAAAGWGPGREKEWRGAIAIKMVIACPVPPAGLPKAKTRALEAGETVWRPAGLSGDMIADILIRAMRLRPVQVCKLFVEKTYAVGPAGHIEITVEQLGLYPVHVGTRKSFGLMTRKMKQPNL